MSRALDIAEAICLDVLALGIPHAHSSTGSVLSLSLSVATASPRRKKGAEELLAMADKALYRAKDGGRNREE